MEDLTKISLSKNHCLTISFNVRGYLFIIFLLLRGGLIKKKR